MGSPSDPCRYYFGFILVVSSRPLALLVTEGHGRSQSFIEMSPLGIHRTPDL